VKRTLVALAVGAVLIPTTAHARLDDPGPSRYTWGDFGADLHKAKEKIVELRAMVKGEPSDCRGLSPEKTVRCAADTFGTNEEQAVAVWQCESNFGVEPPHTDAYHGPFQYLYSTYQSQQESMPDVVKWFELSPAVHDVRSNIMTAVAWASRHGWGPWGCA
jgi:hypothetical protein